MRMHGTDSLRSTVGVLGEAGAAPRRDLEICAGALVSWRLCQALKYTYSCKSPFLYLPCMLQIQQYADF